MPVFAAVTRVIRDDRVTAVALTPFAVHHPHEDFEILLEDLAVAEALAALIDWEEARLNEQHPNHWCWLL